MRLFQEAAVIEQEAHLNKHPNFSAGHVVQIFKPGKEH